MTFAHLAALQRPRFPPPDWSEIAEAVLALNGGDRPLFTLAPKDAPTEGVLSVQGRSGAYALTAFLPSRGRFRYQEPVIGPDDAEEVEIYSFGELRDFVQPSYVCNDVSRVMGLVRHFWEYGELHPAANWQKVAPPEVS